MAVQWMTKRTKTIGIGVHHSGVKRAPGRSNEQAFDQLVEHGKESMTSYSYVILVDRVAKRCEIKQMPWPDDVITNHAYTVSREMIGICVEGNFMEEPLEPWIVNEIKFLLAKLCREFSVKAEQVYGHRDFTKWNPKNATACPGDHLHAALPGIREWLKGELQKTRGAK